jgi:Ser/Thr protein kinase RdoA (MazF antagonist)
VDTYVLVPNAARTALLVVSSPDGARLPAAATGSGAAAVVEALRDSFALDTPYLRRVDVLRDGEQRPVAVLHELDAPRAEWEPPAGTAWLPFGDADPRTLAPVELSASIGRWIGEQRGDPIPEARAAWARPGWLARATEWMLESAIANDLEPLGRPELVAQWSLSSVLKLETDAGHVYLKAIFPLFGHEPVLTQALAARHPELVPEVLAIEARRWILLRELRGRPLGDSSVERWSAGLRAIAHVHRAWVGREDELRSLGAHDRTLEALAGEIGDLGDRARLATDDRSSFDAALPELERRLAELADSPLPETLVHGDFHPWNLMLDGDELRIFDWSDGCLSCPFFDLPTFTTHVREEAERQPLVDAYLEGWADTVPIDELRRLWTLAEPLAHLHHAISYVRIADVLPPDEGWLFDGVPRDWVESALEALDRGPARAPA